MDQNQLGSFNRESNRFELGYKRVDPFSYLKNNYKLNILELLILVSYLNIQCYYIHTYIKRPLMKNIIFIFF